MDPDVIERLYQDNTGPGGELLVKRRQSKAAADREAAAVAAYLAAHPYASATELAEVRAAERGKDPRQVPYFDLTVSAVKSVSVLHASYRVAARQARQRGDQDQAAALDARADEIEAALMDSAREAVAWLEQHATYTRTGHHSARTGEWRDGAGLTASLFLHHLSRDGDPQLHVHVAIWNRVQRADGADAKWRTLDSRSLHNQRLAVAPVADRILETKLSALGYVMVPRADGNGAEIGGVGQDVKDLFSSRAVAVTGELDRLAREYQAVHGKPPRRRTLWLLHQQAGQNTRRTKAQARRTIAGQTGAAEPTEAQRLAAWEAQTARREIQALSAVHAQVAAFAASRAPARAPAVLDDAAKRTAARIAVAEVQKLHAVWSMAQLRFEVHRALPVLEASIDGPAVVDEVARLAVCGRAGTDVVQVTAPDLADVTSLGVRASDGGSIYRPPNEERYCTLAHLDTEEQILAAAKRTVPQLVSGEQARAAVGRTGLNAEQRDAVVMMLTATAATTVLVAPAGAGKSHTMAGFARLWTTFTGRRVIGLTTSTNAARVLAHEGLAESYNIAQFLGKTEGSDELRRPVPLHRDDVLVLDEASQLATADLAMIGEAARQAGARIIATGDTAQLGAVEAGGMFRLLAQRGPRRPAARGPPVRRRMGTARQHPPPRRRPGRGRRLRPARPDPRRRPRDRLRPGRLPVARRPPARQGRPAARRVQRRSRRPGPPRPGQAHPARHVGPPQAALADGNHAGVGDLIRARLNTEIDAGGRPLTNRDTLQITAFRGPDAEVRRQRLDGTWTETFRVPRAYLAASAELAYAGNVHVAQGRTVDTAHLLVTDSLSRQALYVGMTRGRQANTAHVVTGNTAPPGHEPYQQATPESVLAGIMGRDDGDLSATEQIRQAQDRAGGTGHLLTLWSAAIRQTLHPDIDRADQGPAHRTRSLAVRPRALPPGPAPAAPRRPARRTRHQRPDRPDHRRADGPRPVHHQRPARPPPAPRPARPAPRADLGPAHTGHRPAARPRARRRARRPGPRPRRTVWPPAPNPGSPATSASSPPPRPPRCAPNTPAAPASPPPTAKPPGSPTPTRPSHPTRTAADPNSKPCARPSSPPWRSATKPTSSAAWTAANSKHEPSKASAPASPPRPTSPPASAHRASRSRRLQQSADARVQHDHTGAASAAALAAQLAAERQRLEAANARYEQWSADTHVTRDTAGKATAELHRRGQAQPDGEPDAQPEDKPQLTAGCVAAARGGAGVSWADTSEYQAASNPSEFPAITAHREYEPAVRSQAGATDESGERTRAG